MFQDHVGQSSSKSSKGQPKFKNLESTKQEKSLFLGITSDSVWSDIQEFAKLKYQVSLKFVEISWLLGLWFWNELVTFSLPVSFLTVWFSWGYTASRKENSSYSQPLPEGNLKLYNLQCIYEMFNGLELYIYQLFFYTHEKGYKGLNTISIVHLISFSVVITNRSFIFLVIEAQLWLWIILYVTVFAVWNLFHTQYFSFIINFCGWILNFKMLVLLSCIDRKACCPFLRIACWCFSLV